MRAGPALWQLAVAFLSSLLATAEVHCGPQAYHKACTQLSSSLLTPLAEQQGAAEARASRLCTCLTLHKPLLHGCKPAVAQRGTLKGVLAHSSRDASCQRSNSQDPNGQESNSRMLQLLLRAGVRHANSHARARALFLLEAAGQWMGGEMAFKYLHCECRSFYGIWMWTLEKKVFKRPPK